jgi:hypothetical protein
VIAVTLGAQMRDALCVTCDNSSNAGSSKSVRCYVDWSLLFLMR